MAWRWSGGIGDAVGEVAKHYNEAVAKIAGRINHTSGEHG
jgi:hypothetical protein